METIMLKELVVAGISPLYPILWLKTADTVDKGAQQAMIKICLASIGNGNATKINPATSIVPTILKIIILIT